MRKSVQYTGKTSLAVTAFLAFLIYVSILSGEKLNDDALSMSDLFYPDKFSGLVDMMVGRPDALNWEEMLHQATTAKYMSLDENDSLRIEPIRAENGRGGYVTHYRAEKQYNRWISSGTTAYYCSYQWKPNLIVDEDFIYGTSTATITLTDIYGNTKVYTRYYNPQLELDVFFDGSEVPLTSSGGKYSELFLGRAIDEAMIIGNPQLLESLFSIEQQCLDEHVDGQLVEL